MESDGLGLVRGGFFEKVVLGSTVNARARRGNVNTNRLVELMV